MKILAKLILSTILAAALCGWQADDAVATSGQTNPDSPLPSPSKAGSSFDISEHWHKNGAEFNLAISADARFKEISPGNLELSFGTLLIEARKPLIIKTELAEYKMKPSSLILYRIQGGLDRVFVILEGLDVQCQDIAAQLRFGEEAVVSDHEPTQSEIMGEEELGVRQVKVHNLKGGGTLSTMEFSLIQAVEREPLLQKITHSRHPHDKGIKAKLLKSAAVLNMVTAGHGQYSSNMRRR